MKQPFESQPASGRQNGDDMAMMEGTIDLQELGTIADRNTSLEDGAKVVNDLGRQLGKVGDGFFSGSGNLPAMIDVTEWPVCLPSSGRIRY